MKINSRCCLSMATTSEFHEKISTNSSKITTKIPGNINSDTGNHDGILNNIFHSIENIPESSALCLDKDLRKMSKNKRQRLQNNHNYYENNEINDTYNYCNSLLQQLIFYSDSLLNLHANSHQTRYALRRTDGNFRFLPLHFPNSTVFFVIVVTMVLNVCCATVAMPYRTIADDAAGSIDHSKFHSVNKESIDKKHDVHNNKKRRCEPITIPLCQRIGYNMTSFPNGYGHERQEEAGLEVHQFYPLVEVNCYKHLKFFLCSMYTPICQDNYELPVMPCREVCLEARKNCAPLMQKYGFRWPATLECNERLPKMSEQEATGNICAAPPDTFDPEDASSGRPKESNVDDNALAESGEKSFNRVRPPLSPPLVGIKVVDGNDAIHCECKCTQPFYALARSDARVFEKSGAFMHNVQNVSNCAYACRSEAIYSPQDRAFLNTWISVWSGICLTLSAFTVLTFLTDVSRFPYPERPIFFLSLCQLMVSLGFMLRVFYGHERVACDNSLLKTWSGISAIFPLSNPSSPINNLENIPQNGDPLCVTVFVLIYFFGMSASAWWVVLSLSWVLAAVPHWSTEWIAKYSAYFHLFAWLTPAIQTVLVVAFNAVDGDPILGICYVGSTNVINLRLFVLGPLIVYFCVGVSFLSIGFLNLWGIRSNLKKTHPGVDKTSKLTQLMSKIGIFSVLYTVPAIFVILVLFYEQHYRNAWEQAKMCPCAQQIDNQSSTMILLSLIKSASMLVVGWTSGVWILSAKTLQSWRRVFTCGCFCCDQETRRRRRQGYFPAVNRLSGSGGCGGNGAVTNAMSASHANQLLHDDITHSQIHQQFQSSTLPYSMSGEHSLNRQYQHLILNHNNNNNPNSPFHHHHNQNHMHRFGGGDNCMSPITYATNSGTGPPGTLRHFVGGMPDKV